MSANLGDLGNRKNLDPDDFYYSKEGYIVFTATYLMKRGYCCENGCQHCPYGFDKKLGKIKTNKGWKQK